MVQGYKAQGSGSFRSFFTAGNGELQGSYIDLLKTGDSSETAPQTLNGQLSMPAYSVQYLKML